MKYRLLTVLILSLSVFNLSVAGEKRKSNYFGDDNYHAGEIKKSKNNLNHQSKRLESGKKQSKRPRRLKLKTDKH